MRLILILAPAFFFASSLTAQHEEPFTFIVDVAGNTESITGLRRSNGDGTDTVLVVASSPAVAFKLWTLSGGELTPPYNSIDRYEAIFIEHEDTGPAGYWVGSCPPLLKEATLNQSYLATAGQFAFYFLILLVLAWYARHN